MNRHICVIDGNSLMHRGYHAISFDARSNDGTPTNAVLGFLNMFFRYLDFIKPDYIACAFDVGKCTHRLDIFPEYKANRPHMDDDLRVQFPVIEEILQTLDIPILKVEGWEGDDILGTVSRMCDDNNIKCSIITGDKDANQLINDNVEIVTSDFRGNIQVRDSEYVKAKFNLDVSQFIDYLALMGDSIDNIPGIKGVGDKRAVELLNKYGNLEGIYAHLDDFKGKWKENIETCEDMAYLSRELATINCDLDLDINISNGSSFDFNLEDAEGVFKHYSLYKSFDKLKATKAILDSEKSAGREFKSIVYPEIIDESYVFDRMSTDINAGKFVALSYVFPSKRQLKSNPYLTPVLGIAGEDWMSDIKPDAEIIKYLVEDSVLIGYDVKEILEIAYPHDTNVETLIDEKTLIEGSYFDLHVIANSIDTSRVFSKQEEFYTEHSSEEFDTETDIFEKARKFAYINLNMMNDFSDDLSNISEDAFYVFNNIDMPLLGTLCLIERNGCNVDDSELNCVGDILKKKINILQNKIYEIAGEEFNIDSPQVLSKVLFEKLGINSSKKTKTGKSTSVEVLRELKDEHPICGYVIEYREYKKLVSTYIDALPKIKKSDGLIHTTFNLASTATGRLSSTEPNLQNIPVRSNIGRQIRESFHSLDDTSVFLSADYSQIELRLLAHLSGDEALIDAFKSGEDFHAQTAAKIFNVALSDVDSAMRSKAKAVNFGIVYGQSAFTLAKQIHVENSEAKEFIDNYYTHYSGVKRYLDDCIKSATDTGYATTMFGRKRSIPELFSDNARVVAAGQRIAKNMPMQGSAADIIKLAMISLQSKLVEEGLHSKIMIQVHDELDLSVPKDEIDTVSKLVKDVMENVTQLRVPLIVDVNYGQNWAEAH